MMNKQKLLNFGLLIALAIAISMIFSKDTSKGIIQEKEKKIAELTPYKETASKQQKILDNLLAQELEAIPEALRGLVPDNFSPLDKLDYIRRNAETFKTVAPKPNMPTEPGAKNPTNPGLYGGKYADVVEFAKNDPGGYRKWRDAGGGNEFYKI